MPTFGATSYDWTGAGKRDWLIIVSTTMSIAGGPVANILNGNVVGRSPYTGNYPNNDHGFFSAATESGREMKFQFPWPVRIDEFKWYQDTGGSQGTWDLLGSDDDLTYTSLLTGINLGASGAIDTHAFTNTAGYTYYKLVQTAGTTTTSRWIEEIEFKVARETGFGLGTAAGPTAYTNQDGSGNRKSRMLALHNLVSACGEFDAGGMLDGTLTDGCSTATAWGNDTGRELKFGFRDPVVIDEFKWYQHVNAANGTWKIAGSKDDITYTDLGTGIALGGSTLSTYPFVNTDGYNFYKLIQTGGTTSNAAWLREIEFKTSLLTAGGGGGGSGGSQPVVIIIQ